MSVFWPECLFMPTLMLILINIIEISNNPYSLLSYITIVGAAIIRCVLKKINTLLKYVREKIVKNQSYIVV